MLTICPSKVGLDVLHEAVVVYTSTQSCRPQEQHKSQTPVSNSDVRSSTLSSSSPSPSSSSSRPVYSHAKRTLALQSCLRKKKSPPSNRCHLWMRRALAARAPDSSGENREGPRHKRERSDQAAAPAEDSPVCDSQTLSLINQA